MSPLDGSIVVGSSPSPVVGDATTPNKFWSKVRYNLWRTGQHIICALASEPSRWTTRRP